MREIKFLAGLGTIMIFAGIFCCKAAFQKKIFKEETAINVPAKKYEKPLLLFIGGLCIVGGIGVIFKAVQLL